MNVMSILSADWLRESIYIICVMLFIFGLKMLSNPRTARKGNLLSASAMIFAIIITIFEKNIQGYQIIMVANIVALTTGYFMAKKVPMTAMPEMVAIFNGFGGIASALVAVSEYYERTGKLDDLQLSSVTIAEQVVQTTGSIPGFHGNIIVFITLFLSILIGMVTFSGSFIAFGKLAEWISGKPVKYFMQHYLNLLMFVATLVIAVLMFLEPANANYFWYIAGIAFVLGITLTIPIGGADMPVVISLLNSYSGIAVAMTGFVLSNNLLIIAGSLVGASGIILTQIMCKAMNRSLVNVIFGGLGGDVAAGDGEAGHVGNFKSMGAEEAGMILDMAETVIIIPGYGMAVSQAQHAVKELAKLLEKRGVDVKFAIHPVAGRMPGHMNVLLAEAGIDYDKLYDMEINRQFSNTDISIVIGANDVVNPAAKTNPSSPIYGMPVLNVEESRQVLVLKRSMKPGFAGIENDLFYKENTTMVFGDAKKTIEAITRSLEEMGAK
ncbi:MAG: NAD(P)(+) transhydrogenase (Re/Si-specific) subunit beta [Spirochaetia bacterium]|nr:NAD(P)(+) transhydrogenase (Re/Si-specific) subunit beta [Spirochaetia bacterium]